MKQYSNLFIWIAAFATGCAQQRFSGDQSQPPAAQKDLPAVSSSQPSSTSAPSSTSTASGIPAISSEPAVTVSEGGLTVNVPLGKIEITMLIDHVTDFVVSDKEMYAIHHELAIPKIGSFKLFDVKGALIDTQDWHMEWGDCPTYPTKDSNCKSSKVTLKAGGLTRKVVTKISGRGDLRKISSDPLTARVTDCGAADCSAYGATGPVLSGPDTYIWTME